MNNIDLSCSSVETVSQGGKADGLYRLKRLAQSTDNQVFKVPAFFVIAPDWQPSLASLRQLKSSLRTLRGDTGCHYNRASNCDALFAVRSSACGEDGVNHSFAGQFDSYLNVPVAKVSRRILDVRDSLASERIQSYLKLSRLNKDSLGSIFVIVQEMVEATVSGIAFSDDPLSCGALTDDLKAIQPNGREQSDKARPLANLVAGYGDKLVSGHCNGESVWLSDQLSRQNNTLLSDKELSQLLSALLLIKSEWQCPVDIEFCFAGQDLYIVQARPITTVKNVDKQLSSTTMSSSAVSPCTMSPTTIFDASNIQESYPGTTSPLTFSFARRAYSQVYQSFVKLLGVPIETIQSHSDIFDFMLAYHQNKIYYNMQSWYGVIAMLPFYKSNRVFMEQMMGVKSLSSDLDSGFSSTLTSRLHSALSLFKIGYAALTLTSSIKAFNKRLNSALELDREAVAQMSLADLAKLYMELESILINRWDAPVTNDFFAMIAFGLLKSALKKYNVPDSDLHLYLKGQSAVISAAPPQLLEVIASHIADDSALSSAISKAKPEAIPELLSQNPQVQSLYLAYIKQFGDRSLSELKLEVPSVKDDPTVLFKTIMTMVQSRKLAVEPKIGGETKESICQALPVVILSRLTAKLIAQRENLRFARTRVFGMVRLIFNSMGKRLFEAGKLQDARDIFYLSVDEILGFVRGTALNLDLKALVRLRQAEFTENQSPCRVEFDGAYGLSVFEAAKGAVLDFGPESSCNAESLVLAGIAASRGTVRGIARVIKDPTSETLNKGEILVAERTDPGWIVHFALAAGLVTNFGSLLSHTAIVSRELGLPCVVAVSGATETICNGDYIEVDGSSGRVTILKRAVGDLLDAA
ncbi:MAG: hypothetical protein KA794_15560 [Candidatus Obscuribacter sp.]|nr:hypothetical protein [Candidatus Obscuribacter sp.]MBP7578124.1 hypothetical protein [Candidatus Obscuribacter sp.]